MLDHRNSHVARVLLPTHIRDSNSRDWVYIPSGLIETTGLALTRSPHIFGWDRSRQLHSRSDATPSDAPCRDAITGCHSIAPLVLQTQHVRLVRTAAAILVEPKRSHVPKYKGRRKTKRKVRNELTIKGRDTHPQTTPQIPEIKNTCMSVFFRTVQLERRKNEKKEEKNQ